MGTLKHWMSPQWPRWHLLPLRKKVQVLAGLSAFNATMIGITFGFGGHGFWNGVFLGFWGALELVTILIQMRVRS